MKMDDAIEIVKPDPDSHYRLLPCGCGSDNVAYVAYDAAPGTLWGVQCFDCGHVFRSQEGMTRHGIQLEWNGGGCHG